MTDLNIDPADTLGFSETPTSRDGRLHAFELVYAGGTRRAYADDLTSIIEALVPGYLSMTEQQRWEERLAYTIRAQVIAQAELNATDAFLTLNTREQAILQGPRHEQPLVPTWSCPVPLVLIASYYKPAGTNPRPVREQGMEPNVIWLDPSDDETFLNSLHDIGVVSLHTSR